MSDKTKIQALIAQLDTSGDIAAEKVIQKLTAIGAAAVPLLIEAAGGKATPHIRKWSLEALGNIGDPQAAPVLMKALDDERMTVKLHAIRGLGRMKYKKAAKKIVTLLKDESGGIRGNALATLIKLDDKSVSEAIVPALKDPMWYVRQGACKACGHFKIVKAQAQLKKIALKDEKKAVRVAATEALAVYR